MCTIKHELNALFLSSCDILAGRLYVIHLDSWSLFKYLDLKLDLYNYKTDKILLFT
jgi:hypothetical protein